MVKVRFMRVDMRANDPKVIQEELQKQIDEIINDGYDIIGEVRPLPSPNTALQYFIITCIDNMKEKSPIKTDKYKI